MPAPSPVRGVLSGLASLRARIRALYLTSGLARWVLLAAVAVVAFFVADVFLDLPLGVRRFLRLGVLDKSPGLPFLLWLPLTVLLGALAFLLTRGGRGAAGFVVFLFAGLGGLLAWQAWRALRPVTVRLPDAELALAVEQRHRGLEDRLAAALDFAEALPGADRGESRPLMQAVIHQAEREAQDLAFAGVASGRSTWGWVGAALAAVVTLGVVLGVDGAKTALWARRSLLLEDLAWPRATEVGAVLVAADGSTTPWPPEKPFEISVGRGLVVNALAQGRAVDEVVLLDLAEGEQPLPRRMFPVAPRRDLFGVELTNVRQAFRFVLRAGDDQDDLPVYRVEVTVPPAVLDIAADLTFPPYLARKPEHVEGGNLAVPQGTKVVITFAASAPLRAARAVLGDQSVVAERLAADGGREAWRLAFDAERSLRWRLALETAEGRPNDPAVDAYDLAVEEDRAPRLEWIWPRGNVEVTPEGRVPLLARTLDDHAVAGLALDVRLVPDGPLTSTALVARRPDATRPPDAVVAPDGTRTLEANDGPFGRAQVLTYVALDVASLAPPPGLRPPAAPAVRLTATDSKGQRVEGPWLTLDVLGAQELERVLATRRAGVTTAAGALKEDVAIGLARAKDLATGPLGAAERDLLKTIQYAQGKVERDADAAVRDFLDVFTQFVLDRLGGSHATERILAMLDRRHGLTFGAAAPAAGATPHADDPVFPYAFYDAVVEAWRTKALLDNGVLDRMCAALTDAVDVAARLAPAAHAAAVRAAGGERADVEALAAADRALSEGLERWLASLASWENLSNVIVRLKRITEEQRVLLEQLDRKDAPKDGPPGPGSR